MPTEVLYEDGSRSEFHDGGGSTHDGRLAVARFALIAAKHALILNLNTGMEPSAGYLKYVAIPNITAMTGVNYLTGSGRLTASGKRRALADCEAVIDAINTNAVVMQTDDAS